MRRIFLVLAMLALLVLTAIPATAQSDWWDDNDNSRWDGGSDWGDEDKDWGDEDKDWGDDDKDWGDDNKDWWDDDKDWWDDNNDHQLADDNNIWCGWFPGWHGWDLWCYHPWFGWWEAS
jgi:hypothetical protein